MFEIVRSGTPRRKRTIPPVEYKAKPLKKRLATFDTETDPFAENRIVKPFTCGFYLPDTKEYYDFWGDDCIEQFFEFLDANFEEEELCVFCHNFGNFDAYFALEHMDHNTTPFILNGRLGRVYMHGHEFRDSYMNIPVALKTGGEKIDIDYSKMERHGIDAPKWGVASPREHFKPEIRAYQKQDCVALANYISAWLDMFGDALTMAGVALRKLNSFHGFECMKERQDETIRPFYFGGRVECFETGILQDDWKIYDVNSMYPSVMKDFVHPVSSTPLPQKTITEQTYFAHITAWSDGALPVRQENGSLGFPRGTREFYACIHEISAGLETGTLKIKKVHKAWRFEVLSNFAEFIDTYYDLRLKAKDEKDEILITFYKLVMNSSYGKFAQDSRKYENFLFDPEELPDLTKGWKIHAIRNGKIIWSQPQAQTRSPTFYNVATAASITSAARSVLLRAISSAERPIYCDTDSLICRALGNGVRIHDKELGAWKTEAEGDTACIAGKKLYAVFNRGEEIKKASKGVRLTADQIRRVAMGYEVEYANPVPKFNFEGGANFISRKIKATQKV